MPYTWSADDLTVKERIGVGMTDRILGEKHHIFNKGELPALQDGMYLLQTL